MLFTAFFKLVKYEKRAVGAKPLRRGEVPTPPIFHMSENRCICLKGWLVASSSDFELGKLKIGKPKFC
nr:MAG: hypothetical protein EDM05_00875 [Leptolyngbya sp. IPPAS B-1204]